MIHFHLNHWLLINELEGGDLSAKPWQICVPHSAPRCSVLCPLRKGKCLMLQPCPFARPTDWCTALLTVRIVSGALVLLCMCPRSPSLPALDLLSGQMAAKDPGYHCGQFKWTCFIGDDQFNTKYFVTRHSI